MSKLCDNCEEYLPGGCHHMYASQKQCPLDERADPEWLAGKAAWDNLSNRRGFGLTSLSNGCKAEIIESMGRAALAAVAQPDPTNETHSPMRETQEGK